MPRRKAAQNAASKILDIADKENDARSSDAVKIAKEVMVKAGRKKRTNEDKEPTGNRKGHPVDPKEQEMVLSPKPLNVKRRNAKKDMTVASNDNAATNEPSTEDKEIMSLENKRNTSSFLDDTEPNKTKRQNQTQTEHAQSRKTKKQNQAEILESKKTKSKRQADTVDDETSDKSSISIDPEPKKSQRKRKNNKEDTESKAAQSDCRNIQVDPKAKAARSRGSHRTVTMDNETSDKSDITIDTEPDKFQSKKKPARRNKKDDTESRTTQKDSSNVEKDANPTALRSKRRDNKEDAESRAPQNGGSNSTFEVEPRKLQRIGKNHKVTTESSETQIKGESNEENCKSGAKYVTASTEHPKARQEIESRETSDRNTEDEGADKQFSLELKIKEKMFRPTKSKKRRTNQEKNPAVEEPQPISTGEGTTTKRDSYPCEEIKVLQQSEETQNVQSRPRKGRQVKKEKTTVQIEENIQAVRLQISHLWELCYYGEEQQKSCLPFFDESLTSSNLTALKKEETKLRKYYEKNRHIFDNISLQRDDQLDGKLQTSNTNYEMKLIAKDKEVQENQVLHKKILQQLEVQLQEKEKRISQLEKNIQEMQCKESKLQSKEKDENITALRKSLESLNTTYTKENDSVFENSKYQPKSNCETKEDFHEVDVLYEFCQKQKKTIRNLEREIEQMRRDKQKEGNSSSIP
ncbi:uncharacterized protein LOC111138254 isoform X3 [Crassostrea virginica]